MGAFAPDILIFDVDGVLLDVRQSFPEVIRQSVLIGWKKFADGIVDSAGYTREHEWVLKRHGAFNDDYTIPWVLLNIALASGSKKLSEAFPSPARLANLIAGMKGDAVAWVKENYGDRIPREKMLDTAWNLYVGDADHDGLHRLEKPLVHMNWKDMPLPVGVYSGRNQTEWKLGKEKLGWLDFPPEQAILYDSYVRKPSPRGIEILTERMGAHAPLFFGDTASDVQALKAFGGKGDFVAIGDMLPEQRHYPDVQTALEDIFHI